MPSEGVTGRRLVGGVVEAAVDEGVADGVQLRPAAALALHDVGGQVEHARREQLELVAVVDGPDRGLGQRRLA